MLRPVLWVFFLLSGLTVLAAPRPPLPPWPEIALFRWSFDEVYSTSASKSPSAATVDATLWAESWSGYALNRAGKHIEPVLLPLQSAGFLPVLGDQGTIRVWYCPAWSSGKGPGHEAPLLEMVSGNGKDAVTWWRLAFDERGERLVLSAQTAGGWADLAAAPVEMTAGQWRLITLTYAGTNSAVGVDAQTVAAGAGLPVIPAAARPVSALVVGSSLSGLSAEGQFEELTTFPQPCADWMLGLYFNGTRRQAALGPIISLEAELARKKKEADVVMMESSVPTPPGGGGGSTNNWSPTYPITTNGLRLVATLLTNQTVEVTILGGTNNLLYDLFYTPAVTSNSLIHSTWTWLGQEQNSNTVAYSIAAGTNGYFFLGTPQDTDTDGLTDAWETLLTRTSPTNSDSDADGLLDGWEWRFFGNFTNTADGDFDQDGLTNEDEQDYNTDPNTISFRLRFTALQVASGTVTGAVEVLAGVPAQMAVLVDSTNFAAAQWSEISTNVPVNLGSTNGTRAVWVGLRGAADIASQTWRKERLWLDTQAPVLALSAPASSTTSKPMIQVRGLSAEPLARLEYAVINSLGETNRDWGLVIAEHFDTNLVAFTTNEFECPDVALTPGTNTVQITATDRAGNVTQTNFVFIHDLAGDTNAPTVTLSGVAGGILVSGNEITLKGALNDETATVSAEILGGGATNLVTDIVERNGTLWVEGLPLAEGTNSVCLTVSDAASNTFTTNFTLIKSAVALSINPVPEEQLHQASVTVTGYVGNANATVSVNGVAATVQGDGTWTATGVPVNSGGTAAFAALAVLPSNGGTVQAWLYQDKPPRVFIERYDLAYQHHIFEFYSSSLGPLQVLELAGINWREGQGSASNYVAGFEPLTNITYYTNQALWPPDLYPPTLTGTNWRSWGDPEEVGALALPVEQCDIAGMVRDETMDRGGYERRAHTSVKLFTGGKDVPGAKSLFSLGTTVNERDWDWHFGGGSPVSLGTVDPARVSLGAYGPLDTNNTYYAGLPDGREVILTPLAQGTANQSATLPTAVKHVLQISANGVYLNPKTVVSNAEFCVGQKIVFDYRLVPPLADLSIIQSESHQWWLPPRFVNAKEEWNPTYLQFDIVTCHPYQRVFSRYKGFSEEVDPPCTRYLTNNWALQQPSTGIWYLSAGPKAGLLWLDCSLQNGSAFTLNCKGVFAVVAPTILSNVWQCGGIHYYFSTNGFLDELALRNEAGLGFGITFYLRRPVGHSGTAWYTQLIKRNLFYTTPLISITETTDEEFWLDTEIIYNDNTTLIPSDTDNPRSVYLPDSPGVIVGTLPFLDTVDLRDDFRTSLMYLHSTSNSIPVPLALAEWGWHGKVVLSNNWQLVTSNWYAPTITMPYHTHPQWSRVYISTPN